ncbi:RNA polymerase sigma factor [Pseudomonas atagonensis]|uniref:RNA polymerase sigma factor n=1 Tax=Pseudomonas atagonensis TaxID=2609964 RepID=UPI0014079C9E|nr:sigma-70 family RNA polymerase sigma factor [Pseudomonas atagonensis]
MQPSDDLQFLQCLLSGEQKAFVDLVNRYQGAMRAVAVAIVGRRHMDDVVQEAWLAVVRGLAGFQGRSSLKTWILTITANAAKCRYGQNRRNEVPLPVNRFDEERFASDGSWQAGLPLWHEDTPEALLHEHELCECLERALNALSETQRSVLILRERQGLELEDIAQLLDLSLTNTRVLLHRARLSVFAAVESYQKMDG